MIWTARTFWDGGTCIILAGGESVRETDLHYVRQRPWKVITINDSWRTVPGAVHYFNDASWWNRQTGVEFGGRSFWVKGGDETKELNDHPQVHVLRFTGQLGLETDPSGLRHGNNSGYSAINLAYHLGAKKILLIGYDMRSSDPAYQHKLTYFMLPLFEYLVEPLKREGIEVINTNPESALTLWPYKPLPEVI